MTFQSINPYSELVIAEYPAHTTKELDNLLQQSATAFKSWKNKTAAERCQLVLNLVQKIEDQAEKFSFDMAEEMGKTFSESKAEVLKSAAGARFFAEKSVEWIEPKQVTSDSRNSFVVHQPLGGVLLVMPWNFPMWQVLRAAIPALCMGNVIVVKHAPNVMRYAEALEQLFREAGFPEGVYTNLRFDVEAMERVVSHEAIAAVSLTGSEKAGRSMAALAGKYLKKCVLELGGSDPFLVLPDADIAFAGEMAAKARMINNGQSCIAAKRFLVQQAQEKSFTEAFIAGLEKFQPGNPTLPNTMLGPQARKDLCQQLVQQKARSLAQGAELVYEMKTPLAQGFFFLPTLLRNAQPGMACFDEEVFGPIGAITTYQTIEEAVALANQTRYGLGASIYTANEQTARQLALRLDCGTVAINTMVRSKPMLPFGGVKASGYGKELSEYGFFEFSNAKSVVTG